MATVFTYGSLMCEDIMAAVSGFNNLHSEAAVLKGFARYAVIGEAYPAIVQDASTAVEGRIYFGVDQHGLARLDVFEGDWYTRETLAVETHEGVFVSAETYVFRDECEHLVADWHWNFEHFLKTGKQTFIDQYLGYKRLLS
ncbi:gamma-glutamylcyclotransferase family protein [Zhongshania sp. BJYM1]|uniref:gamma-glutamylcyclotransferase family protein n=1 Tax=Zhongshania aquatica TaxID=2965069 RepID=UPI0022B4AE50|nr:gamma-glutamylcyclotransferase family protein [Marortus sp. BJYM1]